MTENEFNWKGFEWRVGQPWGITHPKRTNNWYSPTTVNIKDDVLELSINYEPKEFEHDGVKIVKPYSVGLVSCKNELSYGTWSWKCKLPYGTNLWPALWTCAFDSWPPEIDMVEGYTYPNDKNYIKNLFTTYLETNVHYSVNGVHKQVKAQGIPTIIYKLFHKDVDEYSFKWTKDYIKFYFNGVLVRTVRDKKALNDLNKNNKHYPIMNLQINEEYTQENYENEKPIFRIYDFKYSPNV